MKWFLIFCSHVYSGNTCLPPQAMANLETCRFFGSNMSEVASAVGSGGLAQSAFKCVRL